MLHLRSLPLLFALAPAVMLAGEGDDFFEAKVRPVLVERCYECHSSGKKIKGGLALDSRAGWQRGGDSGPALLPGKPDESLLIKAVRYTDPDLSMPPKKRLGAAEVAVLTEWVERGAPDPRDAAAVAKKSTAMTLEEARSHWAFQPIPAAVFGSIDERIDARLAREGLSPNPPADARALVRRVYFDVIGLPPTFEQVEAFAADSRPDRFPRLVEELLARPEYGQRWARHWLDVARYSDTTEKSTDGERRIPFAHTYRDYVVDALNADKPFDRFIIEQIAADLLPAEENPDLRALGFLTVGRRFEGNIDAPQLIIDDRIDVISRGFLGLTMACARCHDHKFDAISAADYYSLYGIIASCREPLDLPEVGRSGDGEPLRKYREQRAALLRSYEEHIDACTAKARQLLRDLAPEYLQRIVQTSPNHRTVEGFVPLDTPRGLLVRGGAPRWEAFIAESLRRGQNFFALWPRLLALKKDEFATRAAEIIADASADPEEHHSPLLAALKARPPTSMPEAAAVFGEVLAAVLKAPAEADIGQLLEGADSPLQFTREEIRADLVRFITEHQLVSRPDGEKAGGIRQKLTVLEASAPVERAMAVEALPQPVTARVMLRGDRNRLGPAVPRRIPAVLASVDAREHPGDGRLELARAIASPRNPLTARVIVNRVWQQHFGTGLVASADNFGAFGERPSHPELLDHLAAWLIAQGWSLKALHRHILTSAAWQRSSAAPPRAMEKDPANRLLWRMAPRRLEFEPMRDALLAVSGELDTRAGGRGAPLADTHQRRALYGYTDRFRIPALLRNFDVANPDTSIAKRSETTNALQALYYLNSPFVRARAGAVAAATANAGDRIEAIFRRVLARRPDAGEAVAAAEFLGEAPDERRWAMFAQGLLLSNEFVFCD